MTVSSISHYFSILSGIQYGHGSLLLNLNHLTVCLQHGDHVSALQILIALYLVSNTWQEQFQMRTRLISQQQLG